MVENIKEITKKPAALLGIFLGIALVMILVSTFALHIPIVAVCIIVILDAVIAACLNRIPVWVHGLVVIAQIVVGIVFAKTLLMVLMSVVYVAAVALLYFWSAQD